MYSSEPCASSCYCNIWITCVCGKKKRRSTTFCKNSFLPSSVPVDGLILQRPGTRFYALGVTHLSACLRRHSSSRLRSAFLVKLRKNKSMKNWLTSFLATGWLTQYSHRYPALLSSKKCRFTTFRHLVNEKGPGTTNFTYISQSYEAVFFSSQEPNKVNRASYIFVSVVLNHKSRMNCS